MTDWQAQHWWFITYDAEVGPNDVRSMRGYRVLFVCGDPGQVACAAVEHIEKDIGRNVTLTSMDLID